MRRLLLASAIAAVAATSAIAGGYVAPVVAPAPVVVEKGSSSSAGIWIPLALLLVIGLIVANDDDGIDESEASDIRLKTDITRVGTAANGLPLYHFRYHGLPAVYEGVMAQDVLARFPDAVVVRPGGVLAVKYDMLGLEMKVVH